jgi:uncharacterized protein (DUF1684 family)
MLLMTHFPQTLRYWDMVVPDPFDFAAWLAANPPPDLQALVAGYGNYSAIPPAAWIAFDAAREDWNLRRLERLGGPSAATREALAETRSRPSRKRKT